MKKSVITLIAAVVYSVGMMAQTDDNALRINFTGTDNPIETEHMLEGLKITYSEDGEEMELHVNGADVTYQVDDVSGMTYFRGTPSVSLTASGSWQCWQLLYYLL